MLNATRYPILRAYGSGMATCVGVYMKSPRVKKLSGIVGCMGKGFGGLKALWSLVREKKGEKNGSLGPWG